MNSDENVVELVRGLLMEAMLSDLEGAEVANDIYRSKSKSSIYLDRALPGSLDVRYMRNIRSFKEKIKSSYSCNPQLCPKIKERYEQHQEKHHCSSLKTLDSSNDQTKSCGWQDVALSPVISTHPILNQYSTDTHSIQANLSTANTNQYMNKSVESRNYEQTQVTDRSIEANEVGLRRTETKSVVTPKRYFYAEQLEYEILKWLTTIPIYPHLNESSTILKENTINELINNINALSSEFNQPDYDEKVKREIYICLNTLPIWCPGTRRNQVQFKDNLCENLLMKIYNLNSTYFGNINNTSFLNINNISKHNMDEVRIVEDEVNNELSKWVTSIAIDTQNSEKELNKTDVKQIILDRLRPMLNKPTTTKKFKLILKGKIVDILNDLPLMISSGNKRLYHNRLAEELANRILSIHTRRQRSDRSIYNNRRCPKIHSAMFHRCANEVIGLNLVPKANLKLALNEEVTDCLEKCRIIHLNGDISENITNILIDYIEAVCSGDDKMVKNEILKHLCRICNINESRALYLASVLVESVRNVMTRDLLYKKQSIKSKNPEEACLSNTVSVLQSVLNRSRHFIYPVTSTPKKRELPTPKKDIPKLNAEEKSYLDKLAAIIRNWLDKLPNNYNVPKEKEYKEVVIMDLAGDIMDAAKLLQVAPDELSDKRNHYTYFVRRWLLRFEMIENLNEANQHVHELVNNIINEPEPIMTRSQYGSRQAMANIKHAFGTDAAYGFVPLGRDVLEDEISIWMNEQSNDIYLKSDKSFLNKMVQELADKIQQKLVDKRPSKEIADDIIQWLNRIVKPEEKKNVNIMSEKLKERIVKVPQDQTLHANYMKRVMGRESTTTVTNEPVFPCCSKYTSETSPGKENEKETDKILKEVIAKFIDHNYNVDDQTARGAFNQLLMAEMRKLTPPTREGVCEKFETHEVFSPEKLKKELQILKDISDWLKYVPMDGPFNSPGNEDRIDFVNGLAKEICEIEENRIKLPGQIDYDVYLASIILEYMRQLPVSKNHSQSIGFMIKQLMDRIAINRPPISCQNISPDKTISSIHDSGLHAGNCVDFIKEFLCLNSDDIGDDELKFEAWAARLMKEIKKIMQNYPNSNYVPKAKVYNKLINVSIPDDEHVRCFNLKLHYAKEISECLNNLPLLPTLNEQNNEVISTMVSNLAEKMCEREKSKKQNPNDPQVDEQLVNYITVWISELPLVAQHEVAVPVVIHQLMNRMEKVDRENLIKESAIQSTDNGMNKSAKTSPKSQRKTSNLKSCKTKPLSGKNQSKSDNPDDLIVNAIENWCKNLQIQGKSEDVKKIKGNLVFNILRKIGELNTDPEVHADYVYDGMLTDAIDEMLDRVPRKKDAPNETIQMVQTLVDQIMEFNKLKKELESGKNYKKKLENTINESISNPFPWVKTNDPGFEMYKNRLANMFLLENFDHSSEDVKLKYEKRIKEEINKYFQSVLNRNQLPITEDQLRNELYSNLFQVPIPNETPVLDVVEEIKTRCEIEAWYDELPLQEPSGLGEISERDKILTMLSKKIHEIEKKESRSEEKLHSEIKKWLSKLPVLPEHRDNVDQLVKDLVKRLKSTEEARKCKSAEKNISRKSTDTKNVSKKVSASGKKGKESIQAPGPNNVRSERPCCETTTAPQQKAADLIIEIVESWCSQLPLNANTPQEEESIRAIKQNLITKLIIKINELNVNPEIFNNDLVYDSLLNEELEMLLATLPVCCDFQQSKNARKLQLIEAIKSIKPLIKRDKSRQIYKQQLKETVNSILEAPQDTSPEKLAVFHNLMEEIIDNFEEYHYNKDNDDIKQLYKLKLHEAMMKYFSEVCNKDAPEHFLILRNKLICELSKVPLPSEDVLREEVQEIRMKNEVSNFFNDLSFREPDKESNIRNDIKTFLAKRLNEIEKTGHNCTNHKQMKDEIIKCLRKVGAEINSEKIDAFIDKLKENEMTRKAPPPIKPGSCCLNKPPGSSPIGGGPAVQRQNYSYFGPTNSSKVPASIAVAATSNAELIRTYHSQMDSSSPEVLADQPNLSRRNPPRPTAPRPYDGSRTESEWFSLESTYISPDDPIFHVTPFEVEKGMEHSLIIRGGELINPLSDIHPGSFVNQSRQQQNQNQLINIPPIPVAPIASFPKGGEATHQSICPIINVGKPCRQSEGNNQDQLRTSQIQNGQVAQRSLGGQLQSQNFIRSPSAPYTQSAIPVNQIPPCCQPAMSRAPTPPYAQPAPVGPPSSFARSATPVGPTPPCAQSATPIGPIPPCAQSAPPVNTILPCAQPTNSVGPPCPYVQSTTSAGPTPLYSQPASPCAQPVTAVGPISSSAQPAIPVGPSSSFSRSAIPVGTFPSSARPATPVCPTPPCAQTATPDGPIRPCTQTATTVDTIRPCAQPATSVGPPSQTATPMGPIDSHEQPITSENRIPLSGRQLTWCTPESSEPPQQTEALKTVMNPPSYKPSQNILTSDEEAEEFEECKCSRRRRRKNCRGKPYCYMPLPRGYCEDTDPFWYGIPCPFGFFYF